MVDATAELSIIGGKTTVQDVYQDVVTKKKDQETGPCPERVATLWWIENAGSVAL